MRISTILFAFVAMGFGGCATLNQPDRDVLQQHRVSPALYEKMIHEERISLPDIMELAEKRVPGPFTVHYLSSTYAVYHLTSDDVVLLRHSGVSRLVIDYLMTTPAMFAPRYDPYLDWDDPYWWDYSPGFAVYGHDHHRR